jgi:hypothetical protein
MLEMLLFGIGSALALLSCAIWYGLSLRHNRRKAVRILRWIEAALAGHGCVIGIRWLASSRFKIPLRLASTTFQRAWILVELSPCELPSTWLINKMQKRQDLLVFQADLELPPAFNLDVHNLRWLARSVRKKSLDGAHWTLEQASPLVISTRMEWQKEMISTMSSLAGINHRDFLNVRYQRNSPNFSVTLPLKAFAPNSPARTYIFETMQELAGSSSTSLS